MMMQFFTNRAKTLAPKEAAVGDRLPYLGHLDEVTLKTRDGLLVHMKEFWDPKRILDARAGLYDHEQAS